jgi:hypothetical protein
MNNTHEYRSTIVNKAREIVTDQEYVDRWFEAEDFFRETYCTGIRKECFFITKDEWMSGDIYALRAITPGGIETIGGPQDSFEAAEELLRAL